MCPDPARARESAGTAESVAESFVFSETHVLWYRNPIHGDERPD